MQPNNISIFVLYAHMAIFIYIMDAVGRKSWVGGCWSGFGMLGGIGVFSSFIARRRFGLKLVGMCLFRLYF